MNPEDIAISVKNVSKNFILPHERANTVKSSLLHVFSPERREVDIQHALKDISFEVKRGEFFGIVGRNGSGKSTLLKILAGIYQPTSGGITTHGKLVPFIELGVGFNGELTGRENVYLNGALLGFSKQKIDALYEDIVDFAELGEFMDQRLKNYSSGMQVRLAFSLATRAQTDILLVDEVLAVGDAEFQRKCFDYFRTLKKSKTTVVFVSHDMNAVREYCDRAVLIEDSHLVASGTADKIATQYSKLFTKQEVGAKPKADSDKRWGDGAVKYDHVEVRQTGAGQSAQITITTKATAQVAIDSPVFGFVVRNAAGQFILGTNTRIVHQKLKDLKAGEKVTIQWTFENVLSDGEHYVEPAIVHDDGVTVCDWWEEASSFTVLKEDRTPYLVTPYIAAEIQ